MNPHGKREAEPDLIDAECSDCGLPYKKQGPSFECVSHGIWMVGFASGLKERDSLRTKNVELHAELVSLRADLAGAQVQRDEALAEMGRRVVEGVHLKSARAEAIAQLESIGSELREKLWSETGEYNYGGLFQRWDTLLAGPPARREEAKEHHDWCLRGRPGGVCNCAPMVDPVPPAEADNTAKHFQLQSNAWMERAKAAERDRDSATLRMDTFRAEVQELRAHLEAAEKRAVDVACAMGAPSVETIIEYATFLRERIAHLESIRAEEGERQVIDWNDCPDCDGYGYEHCGNSNCRNENCLDCFRCKGSGKVDKKTGEAWRDPRTLLTPSEGGK